MMALQSAREEYEKIISRQLVNRGLRKIHPPSFSESFVPGDFVYVYREKLKQFTGPHVIASIDGKAARVHLGERTGPRSFNISQLKRAPIQRTAIDELAHMSSRSPHVYHVETI